MGENVVHHATHGSPTPEEFEEARNRELARLNVRLSSWTGEQHHTHEDLERLKGDTAHKRTSDMDVVRRWVASSEKYGGGSKSA